MLHGVYCLLFRPAQMYSLHSWAFSTTTLVFVFLESDDCIKVTLTIRRSRWHPLLFLTTVPLQTPNRPLGLQSRKCSSHESRIKLLDCPTDFIMNKYWETKAFLLKNKSHFLCSETNKLRGILHHMFQTASHMLSHFQPLRRKLQWRAVLKIVAVFMFWIQLFHLKKMPLMNSKAIEILQSKNCPHGAIFPALTGDRGKLCHGKCKSR